MDFDAPVGSCFYFDPPEPDIMGFSSSSVCSTYATCSLQAGGAFRMEITTTLPEDEELEITNFRYKEYDTLV